MQLQHFVGKYKILAFTIVEMMVVVAIVALLITAAIPSYENLLRNTQSMTIASNLAASLRLAKSEAIKRGLPVTVCPISNSFTVSVAFNEAVEQWPCITNSTDWTAWKVMIDPQNNRVEDSSDGNWPVLQYVGDNPLATITTNVVGRITFDPMGFANVLPASTTRTGWTWASSYSGGEWSWSYTLTGAEYTGAYSRTFTITPAGCTGNNARTVVVNQNGVITVSTAAC